MQMCVVGLVGALCLAGRSLPSSPETAVNTPLAAPSGAAERPVGETEGVFHFHFEKGDLRFNDILTLHSGAQRLGKVMEWANQVLLFEAGGAVEPFAIEDVERFQFRRQSRHRTKPELPDLTVAYIQRLPRDPHWHGRVTNTDGLERPDVAIDPASWHPAAGTEAEFRVHVLNAGAAASAPVPYRVLLDGAELNAGTIPALDAGQEHIVEVAWPWQDGRHRLRIELDPGGTTPEIVRGNNLFEEPTDALGIVVVVAADRYQAFRQVMNAVDSWCFEDWVQHHVRALNGLFVASAYPSSPQGITERVRCDRIIVVDDPLDSAKRDDWAPMLLLDGKPDTPANYAALWLLGPFTDARVPVYDALKLDWAGLRHIAAQLGLVDLKKLDTAPEQCLVLDQKGRYVERHHLFPLRRTMMYQAGAFTFDEPSAAYLNQVRGRPRGLRGDYLYQLPERIFVEVDSNVGIPLTGVQVDAFQLMAEGPDAGMITGANRGEPLYSGTTGSDGRLALPDLAAPLHQTPRGYTLRPNPFGKIALDGSNGLLLLRLRQEDREEFHFLRLFDCQVARLRGAEQEYVHSLWTRFAAPESPPAPPYAAVKVDDRKSDPPAMYVRWPLPDLGLDMIEEFRLYRRTGLGGDEGRPWTLVETIGKQGRFWIPRADCEYFETLRGALPYSRDTFFAVTTVDRLGRESRMSQPGFVAYDQDCLKLTMDQDGNAYMTVAGEGMCRMLRWDDIAGTQPCGVRTRQYPGYAPSFWGIALGADGRLIVTDPANHVLAFYDRGDLVQVIPSRKWWPGFASDEPGEFYSPADVAVDEAGNIYVADFGNDRVQVLDSTGQFKSLVDESFRFDGPHALGLLDNRLCVTDRNGTRCRVYEVQAGEAKFLRELPRLSEADRAVVSGTDLIYVCGKDEQAKAEGVLIYKPQGETAVFDRAVTEGIMGKFHRPRGLYLYRGGTRDMLYFVNEFPFDLGTLKME